MSIVIAIIIMIAAGILGGFVNYLLPSNEKDGLKIRQATTCIILGVGATLLVPLFLEIAQSKLLDKMHFGWNKPAVFTPSKDTVILRVDTASGKNDTTYVAAMQKAPGNNTTATNNNPDGEVPKSYLLFAAYCLVAAAAGFRFIDSVVNSVVKEKENAQLKHENQDLKKETEKRQANSQISQRQEETEVRKQLMEEKAQELRTMAAANPGLVPAMDLPVLPALPPVTHPDDPQKGRFGGKAENNFRRLAAEVTPSAVPNFFKVKLWVESTDVENHPLNSDVIYYIHDSFSPSVFTYKPQEFVEGKAVEDEILSYGAFTVGVITDNGKTMLELDLAEQKNFPKEFRER